MKRKKLIGILCIIVIACYFALLLILVLSERANPNSGIHTLWDAIWYSLVTLATVGYGDVYPTSVLGRIVGIFFVFGSIFLFSAVVSAFLSIFTGQFLPMLYLYRHKDRDWYIFTEDNINAQTLALDLLKNNPSCIIVYLHPEQDKATTRMLDRNKKDHEAGILHTTRTNVWNLPLTAEALAERYWNTTRTLICISDSSLKNLEYAKDSLSLGYNIVCCTNLGMDQMPSHVKNFQPLRSRAQIYWNQHPLSQQEQNVLFIGCGSCGEQLLERALLTNIFDPDQHISYHVFGDSKHFQMCHSHLWAAIQSDHLAFHTEDWRADIQLLRSADRIIICTDDDEENMLIELEIRRYFSDNVNIHLMIRDDMELKNAHRASNTTIFGSASDMFTEEYVINDYLSLFPWAMNEYYRKRHTSGALYWDDLSDLMQQYYHASASHMIVKVRLLLQDETITKLTSENCNKAIKAYRRQVNKNPDYFQRLEHMRWLRFYYMYNWEYGKTRDAKLRQHPQLVTYEQLSPEEAARYKEAWNVIGLMGDILKYKI